MMILLLRRNTLDLRLAEEKATHCRAACEMGDMLVPWRVSILATLPMYRHLYCTLTLFELWTGWEGIWTSLQGTARPPTKNNKTHTSNMEQSIELTYQLIPERSSIIGKLCWLDSCSHPTPGTKNHMIDSLIFSFTEQGIKFPTWNMFPPHLRPQKVQGFSVPFLFIKKGAQGSLNKRNSL